MPFADALQRSPFDGLVASPADSLNEGIVSRIGTGTPIIVFVGHRAGPISEVSIVRDDWSSGNASRLSLVRSGEAGQYDTIPQSEINNLKATLQASATRDWSRINSIRPLWRIIIVHVTGGTYDYSGGTLSDSSAVSAQVSTTPQIADAFGAIHSVIGPTPGAAFYHRRTTMPVTPFDTGFTTPPPESIIERRYGTLPDSTPLGLVSVVDSLFETGFYNATDQLSTNITRPNRLAWVVNSTGGFGLADVYLERVATFPSTGWRIIDDLRLPQHNDGVTPNLDDMQAIFQGQHPGQGFRITVGAVSSGWVGAINNIIAGQLPPP